MTTFQRDRVFVIAEIGGNHEGDFKYAQRLTRLAAESGADAVKFQIYSGDHLVNPLIDPDRNRHFKKFQLTKDQYIELAKLCGQLGVKFMASVWDMDAFTYIDKFVLIYKIGSGDLTAYNIIKKIAQKGKPIILSTGLANMEEVLHAVKFIYSINSSYRSEKKLALLQCSSMYPIPDEDANLNVMLTLKEKTGLPVGYSDHTVGTIAVETAVAMGAEIIEIHFTDTREGKTFRDHLISLTKEEIKSLIEKIRKIKKLQGGFEKKPTQSERESNHIISFRRGVYPNRDLNAGEIIKEEDLVTLRPCTGIEAESFFEVVGKKLLVDVRKGQILSLEYFSK
ncbi:MAG: N-acetylneuraminate synthase [Deltaproteobacteria bacterium]|nr:N-acetylneuraminate synthase [Deltaproteobacteria bacterium]